MKIFMCEGVMQPLLGLTDLIQKAHHHFYQGAQFFFPFDQRKLPKIAAVQSGNRREAVNHRWWRNDDSVRPRTLRHDFPAPVEGAKVLPALYANAQRSREL
jgi:hypothetical protein